jgi:uncharacterized protein (DUF305 family)
MKRRISIAALLLVLPVAAAAQMAPGQMGSAMQNCPGMGSHAMMQAKTPGDRALVQSMMVMHQGMQSMKMTGNTDRDFVSMMIPHHEAAVQMAQAELKYGTDPKIKAMAQTMIDAQQGEITAMKAWEAAQKP